MKIKLENLKNKKKIHVRKTGEHKFADCGGVPRCVTCGCDEDDAFVGGEECTYPFKAGYIVNSQKKD